MNAKTKVRKIGNSYGILLPKETLEALSVREGDTLYLTKTLEGGVILNAEDDTRQKMLRIADELMDRYANTLRELAK